ncbi:hypothetical protein PTKIN_Ptkin09bG0093200 [Pterospermum kingtungense]
MLPRPLSANCYLKQHGTTEKVACDELNKQINNAWKDINEEFLKPIDVLVPALTHILNLVRVVDHLYKDEDAYTLVGEVVKTSITSLLIDAISI